MHLTIDNANPTTPRTIALREVAALEPTVSALAMHGLLELFEQMGARQLFPREFGWNIDDTTGEKAGNDARVPYSEICRTCELAMDVTGDDALGLRWAEQLKPHAFVPVSHMLAHVQSLRQAFELLSKFGKLFSDRPFFALLESHDTVIVRTLDWPVPSVRMQAFSTEVILAGLLKMARAICGQAIVRSLSLAYPAPSYHTEYERIFQTAVRFDQPLSGLVLHRTLLDMPAAHADKDVYLALEMVAERRLQRVTQRAPYTFGVRELMLSHVPERVSMTAAARSLGLSVRSLRRQLAAEGTSFRRLEYTAFESVSKWLLRDRKRTIQEIAYELGFADVTTFHRAFKRWTGVTPGQFRGRDSQR